MFTRMFGRKTDLPPYELARARGREEAAIKTSVLNDMFGLGDDGGTWSADLDAGLITFETGRGCHLSAPVQVIGTFDTIHSTWMWGWANDSLPDHVINDARRVKEFGALHGVDQLVTGSFVADETDAWDFAGLAMHLTGAQGVYRGPAGRTLVLLTFGTVTASSLDKAVGRTAGRS